MLLLVSSIKLIAEIALMALAGQWLLGMLVGAKRDQNALYRVFQVLTGPFVKAARLITPRIVLDRHVPLVATLLLVFVWLFALMLKVDLCLSAGMAVCR